MASEFPEARAAPHDTATVARREGLHVPLPGASPGEVRFALGGMVVAFVPCSWHRELKVAAHRRAFISEAAPDATFYIRREPAPISDLGVPLFDSGGNWTLYSVQGQPVIHIRTPFADSYQLAILAPDFQSGDIHCVGEAWDLHENLSPLGYPLEEVLMVNLLARGHGVILHACGIKDGERGILFSGVSGAGKSTMASFWKDSEDTTVLSDDRIIVREHEGRFWAYGTPWHGDARLGSPEAAPLDQIFVLRHATENEKVRLKPLDAVSRLLVRAFPTYWDPEGMAFTLELLGSLTETVPCYELGFVPNEGIVEYVRCVA